MSNILNIDTSLETASVSIAKDGVVQKFLLNSIQKDHASFLHKAIKELLDASSLLFNQIDAIAVVNGPGSYTGLRVGLTSAKGFCYALNKPLITIGTLNVLASASITLSKEIFPGPVLYCPMIDARRSEVYTAAFDKDMNEILAPCNMILNESSFEKLLAENQVVFFGNGAAKWKNINKNENALFINDLQIIPTISQMAYAKFISNNFTDLAYSEPLYIKDFFSP